MLVIALASAAALAYGTSDFLGGAAAKRTNPWVIAAVSQSTAALLALVAALVVGGSPYPVDFAWGLVAGLGGAAGNVLIYRGLATGRMSVVAPVSGLLAAAVPVVVGLATGDRLSVFQYAALAVAAVAIWLAAGGANRRSGDNPGGADTRSVLVGLGAGLSFGIQFAALGQVGSNAGLLPLAASQAIGAALIATIVLTRPALRAPITTSVRIAFLAGLFAGSATIAFQSAVARGELSIAGMITSLYPAATVVLAALVLRERWSRWEGVGLALSVIALVAFALE